MEHFIVVKIMPCQRQMKDCERKKNMIYKARGSLNDIFPAKFKSRLKNECVHSFPSPYLKAIYQTYNCDQYAKCVQNFVVASKDSWRDRTSN